MELKSSKHVIELKDITVEEEMDIIGNKSNTQKAQKTFGNNMILSLEKLSKPVDLDLIDVRYDGSNFISTYVTMMLVTCPPFYNFVVNFNKTVDNPFDFRILQNIYQIIDFFINKPANEEFLDIEPYICYYNSSDIGECYVTLLRYIHNELTQFFFFSEDSWSVPQKEKDIKQIYQEHSPISDIFQGKITSDLGTVKKGYFECLKVGSEKNLEEVLFNKYLIKSPKAMFIEFNKPKAFKFVRDHKISSFVAVEEEDLVLYLNCKGKWHKFSKDEVSEIDNVEGIKNIKYILIYKDSK